MSAMPTPAPVSPGIPATPAHTWSAPIASLVTDMNDVTSTSRDR